MQRRIVLTGGGTAGHVTPNLALIPSLEMRGYAVHYIGRSEGIERHLVDKGIPFHSVPAGKLRRYFSVMNLVDVVKVMAGFFASLLIMSKVRPCVAFSKGGYVSAPVVWAAWVLRIPVVLHESDLTPGLANRLCIPFARKICCAFQETSQGLANRKGEWTGLPIRKELMCGKADDGRAFLGSDGKPVVLVMGGSQGAERVNEAVVCCLERILPNFCVCHVCGEGKLVPNMEDRHGCRQYEYLRSELPDVLAAADVVVSRGGATTLFELMALRKPTVVIPLGEGASRGDQVENAEYFSSKGCARILLEDDLEGDTLAEAIELVYAQRESFSKHMDEAAHLDAVDKVVEVIEQAERGPQPLRPADANKPRG